MTLENREESTVPAPKDVGRKLVWTKHGRDWFAISGSLRADVKGPNGPLGFSHWSVRCGNRHGGCGGTSSVQESKREAEKEMARFGAFIRTTDGA